MYVHDNAPDGQRSKRMGFLLVVLWLMSAADLLFTLWAHYFTPFYELNPIARRMLESGLIHPLVLMKFGLTAVASAIFWHLRGYGRAELALWFMIGIFFALTLRWSSYTTEAMHHPKLATVQAVAGDAWPADG